MAVSMGTVAVGLFAGPAAAQTTSSASRTDSTSDTESQTLQTVIVTVTSQARADLRTPLVATSISSDRLTLLASNSAADVLTTVPALKAEGGGGEVAANIFVAGLPSGGQYQFTPLEFNGMPVISSMGLNSSAPDVYYRPDLGVERLEFVRGGVSNLFGGGGIGGVINFIDKTGSDTAGGATQVEVSDQTARRPEAALPASTSRWTSARVGDSMGVRTLRAIATPSLCSPAGTTLPICRRPRRRSCNPTATIR